MESPVEKDKNTRTLFPDSLFRLWNLRILLYTLVFLWVTVFLYQKFVTEPLEMIYRLHPSDRYFIYSTFNQGIGLLYMLCYLLLLILFLIEFAWCEFYSLYKAEDEKWITISKRIRMGMVVIAFLSTGFIPFLWK